MDEQKSEACSTDGSDGKCIQIFNSKTLKIYLMRHRHKDKKKIILSLSTPRRHIWGVEVHLHSFLKSAQVEDECSVSSPSRFFPLKVKLGTNLQVA